MKSKHLAFKLIRNSACTILGIYAIMQTVSYFRDALLLGVRDFSAFFIVVGRFLALYVCVPFCVFGFIMYLFARPIQNFALRLESGEQFSNEIIETMRKKIHGFSALVIVINIIGFAAGFLMMEILSNGFWSVFRFDRMTILLSNLAGAYIFASIQNALNGHVFEPVIAMLKTRSVDMRHREMNTSGKQALLAVILVFYALTFFQFNIRDVTEISNIESSVLRELVKGSVSREEAGQCYRAILQERLPIITSRGIPDINLITLPWERTTTNLDIQKWVFLLEAGFIFLLAILVLIVYSTEIQRQMRSIVKRASEMSHGEGDFSKRIDIQYYNDIGILGESINRILDMFHVLAVRIRNAVNRNEETALQVDNFIKQAEQQALITKEEAAYFEKEFLYQADLMQKLSESVTRLTDASNAVNEATAQQQKKIYEASSSISVIKTKTDVVVGKTQEICNYTKEMAILGNKGSASSQETSDAIKGIEDAAKKVYGVLLSLGKIAASTNLLALNAAIEAAHAGAAGVGFAVVADEVRTLANSAALETKNIKNLLDEMMFKVSVGVKKSIESTTVLNGLVTGLYESADKTEQIADIIKEHNQEIQKLLLNITDLVQSTDTISEKMTEQEKQESLMLSNLKTAFDNLESLSVKTKLQSDKLQNVVDTFLDIKKYTQSSLESVKILSEEAVRFS